MLVVIEIDTRFTVGIDWFPTVKGVRLGFLAIHVVSATLDSFVAAYKRSCSELPSAAFQKE